MAKGFARCGLILLLLIFNHAASAATVGSLLITEIMANPAAVGDTAGEWFELYNPGGEAINLRGITLEDDGSDRHRIETDLLILPGHFLTLARNGDPSRNGGFTADYVYRDFRLGNGADEIVLRDDAMEWLRLEYGSGFAVAGRSRELHGLGMTLAGYLLSPQSLVYGLGDIGSPGSAGGFAPAPAPSPVPLPPTAWLFASALPVLLSRRIAARGKRDRENVGRLSRFERLWLRDTAPAMPARAG